MSIVEFPAPRQQALQAKYICSACGADRGCNCSAPAVEKLAAKQEQDRQRAKEYRARKAEENQPTRHVTGFDKLCAEAAEVGLQFRGSGKGYVFIASNGAEVTVNSLVGGRGTLKRIIEDEPHEFDPPLFAVVRAAMAAKCAETDDAEPPKAEAPSSLDQHAAEIRRLLGLVATDADKLAQLKAEDPEAFAEAMKEIAESEAGAGAETDDADASADDAYGDAMAVANWFSCGSALFPELVAWTAATTPPAVAKELKRMKDHVDIDALRKVAAFLQDLAHALDDEPPPSGPGGEPEPKVETPAETVSEQVENAVAAAAVVATAPIDRPLDIPDPLTQAARQRHPVGSAPPDAPVPLTPPTPSPSPSPAPTPTPSPKPQARRGWKERYEAQVDRQCELERKLQESSDPSFYSNLVRDWP